jgi:hypothetical protein
MFLSDQGVYSISYGQELNLIANAIPMSEPIESYLRLINWEYASQAIGAYADNRYFLAVPLGSQSLNNAIFVYNFLNQGWESLDTFPATFDIDNMLVAPRAGKNRLFFVNKVGAVHEADRNPSADRYQRSISINSTSAIDGKLITRRYTMGNMDIKRFSRATILCESPNLDVNRNIPSQYRLEGGDTSKSRLHIGYTTNDPDSEDLVAKTVDVDANEDYNIKTSIRKRGYGLQMIFRTAAAKIRGLTVDAILSSRNHVDRS